MQRNAEDACQFEWLSCGHATRNRSHAGHGRGGHLLVIGIGCGREPRVAALGQRPGAGHPSAPRHRAGPLQLLRLAGHGGHTRRRLQGDQCARPGPNVRGAGADSVRHDRQQHPRPHDDEGQRAGRRDFPLREQQRSGRLAGALERSDRVRARQGFRTVDRGNRLGSGEPRRVRNGARAERRRLVRSEMEPRIQKHGQRAQLCGDRGYGEGDVQRAVLLPERQRRQYDGAIYAINVEQQSAEAG